MAKQKTILVAPLFWGLGHATRCIPIINALLKFNYNVILASDGAALLLLQKEFPELASIELPSYNITYPKKGINFKLKLFLKLPSILKTIASEKKLIKHLVAEGKIDGIISDNRFGVRNKKVPSVFITHQLNVLTGNTTYFSSKIHQHIIKKFNECWVPDVSEKINLSGKLGHVTNFGIPIKYMGLLSRMKKTEIPKIYNVLVLLSGPEPQRTLLEEHLIKIFKGSVLKVLLIQGVVKKEQKTVHTENIEIVNFMQTEALEKAINLSEIVVSRSGYTTLMDLAIMQKSAFFIPTPGQYEQKYLARRLKHLGIAPSCKQENFNIGKLNEVAVYKGLSDFKASNKLEDLFCLFECEREL